MSSSASKKIDYLTVESFNPTEIIYSAARTAKLGKDVYISSAKTKGRLYLLSPLMTTWGISSFKDPDTGIDLGRYSMNLNFQGAEYATEEENAFLAKMQELEKKILQDAHTNSVKWFDEELSYDVIKSRFYPIVKYPKIKGADGKPTKKLDLSKSPSIGLKVSNYDGKWGCEIFDMAKNRLFPCEDPAKTPCDFVPKKSQVVAKFQVASIWTMDKTWGVKISLVLCFVQPSEEISQYDVSNIPLPGSIVKAPAVKNANSLPDDEDEVPAVAKVSDTFVEDSDDDEHQAPPPPTHLEEKASEPEPEPEPEHEQVHTAAPKKKVIKKKV